MPQPDNGSVAAR